MPPKKESPPCDDESTKKVTSPKIVRGKDGRFSTPDKQRNKHCEIEHTNPIIRKPIQEPILALKTNNVVINDALVSFVLGARKAYGVSRLFFQKIGGGFFSSLLLSVWYLGVWISGWALYLLGLSQKGFEFWEKKPFWLRCIHGIFSCGATVYIMSFVVPYLPLAKRMYAGFVTFATINHVKELFDPNNKAYFSIVARFVWKGIMFAVDGIIYLLLKLIYHIALFKVTVDVPYRNEHATNKTSPVNGTDSTHGKETNYDEPFTNPLNATGFNEMFEKLKGILLPKN